MERAGEILDAVKQIYDSAFVATGDIAALEAVASAAGGRRCVLFEHDSASQAFPQISAYNLDPMLIEAFSQVSRAGLPNWMTTIPVGRAVKQSHLVSESEWLKSDLYNEAVRHSGGSHSLMARVSGRSRAISHFAVCRCDREDFSDEDLNVLQVLVPHLTNAWQLRHTVKSGGLHAARLEATLDNLDIGVILVDVALKIVFANASAAKIAAERDGLSLTSNGVVSAVTDETRTLQQSIASAFSTHRTSRSDDVPSVVAKPFLQLTRPSGRTPLNVSVVPLQGQALGSWLDSQPVVALFIRASGASPRVVPEKIALAFGLTDREAEFATLLVQGMGVAQIAGFLDISVSTARWHLRNLFEKTGTHRQSELLNIVLRDFDDWVL